MKKSSCNLITGINTNPYFVPFRIWNMNKVLLLVLCILSGNILYAQNDESDLSDTPSTVNIDGLLYYLSENSHTAMVANENSWEGELVKTRHNGQLLTQIGAKVLINNGKVENGT